MQSKVILVIPSLRRGGAERVISILANNLYQRGHQVAVVLLNYSEQIYYVSPGIQVIYLNKGKRNSNIINRVYHGIVTFTNFYKLIKKEKPTYLISFTTSANAWAGLIGSLLNVPYIVSERNTPDTTVNVLYPPAKRVVYEIYKRSKAVVVPAEGIRVHLKKSKPFHKLSNIKVVHNPVSEFKILSESSVHAKRFLLAVGRLHRAKGFDRLIEIFQLIKTPDIDLIILGEGSERNSLTQQIQNAGLSKRIFLPGAKDNIYSYYKQCEAFLLTSRYEGYPNVLIEAMSAGCACVAVDCEFGPSEIIEHGVNGLLIPKNNNLLFAKAIDTVLNDSELKTHLSNNASEIAVSNSISSIVSKWENLIENYV